MKFDTFQMNSVFVSFVIFGLMMNFRTLNHHKIWKKIFTCNGKTLNLLTHHRFEHIWKIWRSLWWNWACSSMRRATNPMRRAILQETFGDLPSVQIGRKIARWKACWVYFLTQLEFFNLEFIYPVKNQISQDWSKCAKWGCLKAECCCSQLLKVFLN